MNLHQIGIVFSKELKDLIRDRRTLISMVVVPMLIMPLLVVGLMLLTASSVRKAQEETPAVMALGGANSPQVTQALRAHPGFRLVPPSPDFTNQVSNKRIRAAVRIPDNFDDALQTGQPAAVQIFFYEGDMKSGFAATALETFFENWKNKTVRGRLEARQIPKSILEPFEIERHNVVSLKRVTGSLFGGLLPYMVILLCMTGGMYPAMDLTAGEKERGTMESLLSSPVSRTQLVLGKFLMVLLAAVTTAVLSLGSMAGTYLVLGRIAGGFLPTKQGLIQLAVDPASVLAVFILILPVAFFLAAAELAISLYARSFKEAQSYLTPLMFAVIVPAALSITPAMEINLKLALIPILNTSLVCKEIMAGSWPWWYMALIFFSTWLYAGLALYLAVKMFQKEEVLLRT
jgi:sodium transport system permease protein